MDTKKHSILIVDDQVENIALLTKILSHDYNILAAKCGQDAVDTAVKFVPEIILLDVVMPEMDGYAVIAELKRRKKTQDIPVIFITGLSNADEEEKGLAMGAADYITKPFTPAIVKLRIDSQIKMLEQFRIIKHLSMIDQLTKLPNRRSFEDRMEADWRKAERGKTPISILIADVDMFNQYNEKHGRSQGDKALCSIARVFEDALTQSNAFAARWSGEEFIILLPNTDADGALEIAEKLRSCANKLVIPDSSGASTKITVSICVNTKTHGRSISMDDFIAEADSTLNDSKDKARNRIYFDVKKYQ